ncbi:cytochrome C oxidase subunit I [Streptomyces sp. NK08204]|uniref:cytochrome C oxidase subunit I n=1 Tax=Streptomyces sp. NK08204 TaxID=2873260 RepID=UPI001CED232A|nr:cytochrome C oxidase subunit I [Streptomyces sp. NK08204]
MSGLKHDLGVDGTLADEVEEYLLWQARIAEAEQRARDFTDSMEWLTTAQRAEIERRYVSDDLQRAEGDLKRLAARCLSLQAEYQHRYHMLRRRCVGIALAVTAGCTYLTVLLWLL